MKPVLVGVLAILVLLLGVPLTAALLVTMNSGTAAAACTPATPTPAVGPGGTPVSGTITLAQANIPNRAGLDGFRASMPHVLSTEPDFVTLNEVSARSIDQIQDSVPGYAAYRDPTPSPGPGGQQSMGNVVAWRTDTWTLANSGRTQIVDDDKGFYNGKPVVWDRFATWATLQRTDGAVVSIVSVHHMINPLTYPRQHDNPPLTRAAQYGQGMDTLIGLTQSLATQGPVLVGGDMNTQASYTDQNWSAVAKMGDAGYGWANDGVDFIFYPTQLGVSLTRQWSGRMRSDHQWIAAKLAMNGAGPTAAPAGTATTTGLAGTASTGSDRADVRNELTALTLGPGLPHVTVEQASNIIAIAEVARDLNISKFGLQIALATAIQESTLRNLTGGDADSAGLFGQRPSTGWGTHAQVTNHTLATQAFFGQAAHTDNPGLTDIPGWDQMELTDAAAAVHRPRADLSGAYATWETVAADMVDLLGTDLTDGPSTPTSTTVDCNPAGASVTVATLNLLGAGHTDHHGGGGATRNGFPSWKTRLPGAMTALGSAGVSIAALQEVHPPQAEALANDYSGTWGMFPRDGHAQNRVIWDNSAWTLTTGELVPIPYFGGTEVGMPLVQLTSTTTGETMWVWSIHNPAETRGNAAGLRTEALRRQSTKLAELAVGGTPVVIAGDFNDARDQSGSSHCQLTPGLTNAFGGSADPCTKPAKDAAVDHIYGTNLTWASALIDPTVQERKISDHPLVVATTASDTTCTTEPGDYNLGPVKPQLAHLVAILAPMFNIPTVGGYRESARDPNGHPAGLAADFMVPHTTAGQQQGTALAQYAQANAATLGVDYIIWYQRIWSADRASEGWRPMSDRGSDTENHRDHAHINAVASTSLFDPAPSPPTAGCAQVVYPVPEQYVDADRHNWHASGVSWNSWHTGTDFSMPCGTPIYAAHAGTVEIDTTQPWAGAYLVKITTGPRSVATWYAHMESVTVSRGQTVAAGDQIGATGDLGNTHGCHLHFEVHLSNGTIYGPDNVNPSDWLAQQVPSRT